MLGNHGKIAEIICHEDMSLYLATNGVNNGTDRCDCRRPREVLLRTAGE